MKKLFTLAIALSLVIAVQAQTPVTVLNANFEDITIPLGLNSNNQYAIKGFYLVDNAKKPVGSSLDVGNSGLAAGMGVDGSQALKLTCVQPDAAGNAAGAIFDVTTDQIDISKRQFGEYIYKLQVKTSEIPMGSIRPFGYTMIALDENGLDVTSATLVINKTAQAAMNLAADFLLIPGYQTLGSVFNINANPSGLNAKFVKVSISIGKNMPTSLTTSFYLDNFTMTGPEIITTGIKKINDDFKVQIYPNPAKDYAQISCADGIKEISVYSFTGSLIKKVKVGANSHKLDISSLPKGIYIISVVNNKGVINTKINKS